MVSMSSQSPGFRRSIIDAHERPLRRTSGFVEQGVEEDWPAISPERPFLAQQVLTPEVFYDVPARLEVSDQPQACTSQRLSADFDVQDAFFRQLKDQTLSEKLHDDADSGCHDGNIAGQDNQTASIDQNPRQGRTSAHTESSLVHVAESEGLLRGTKNKIGNHKVVTAEGSPYYPASVGTYPERGSSRAPPASGDSSLPVYQSNTTKKVSAKGVLCAIKEVKSPVHKRKSSIPLPRRLILQQHGFESETDASIFPQISEDSAVLVTGGSEDGDIDTDTGIVQPYPPSSFPGAQKKHWKNRFRRHSDDFAGEQGPTLTIDKDATAILLGNDAEHEIAMKRSEPDLRRSVVMKEQLKKSAESILKGPLIRSSSFNRRSQSLNELDLRHAGMGNHFQPKEEDRNQATDNLVDEGDPFLDARDDQGISRSSSDWPFRKEVGHKSDLNAVEEQDDDDEEAWIPPPSATTVELIATTTEESLPGLNIKSETRIVSEPADRVSYPPRTSSRQQGGARDTYHDALVEVSANNMPNRCSPRDSNPCQRKPNTSRSGSSVSLHRLTDPPNSASGPQSPKRNRALISINNNQPRVSKSKGVLGRVRGLMHKRSLNLGTKPSDEEKSVSTRSNGRSSPFPVLAGNTVAKRCSFLGRGSELATQDSTAHSHGHVEHAKADSSDAALDPATRATDLTMSLLRQAQNERNTAKKAQLLNMAKYMVEIVTNAKDAQKAAEEAEAYSHKADICALKCGKALVDLVELVERTTLVDDQERAGVPGLESYQR